MRKKVVCMICTIVLSLSVVGCGAQKTNDSSSKAESVVSETEASSVAEVTADSSADEEIDPQLKADCEYVISYYTKLVDMMKAMAVDGVDKNDPEIQKEYEYLTSNKDQVEATKDKLGKIDQSTLNQAELDYYKEIAAEANVLASELNKYSELYNAQNDDSSENGDSDTGEVDPKFKETMDSYEAFFDEYVEFMKKYSESNDVMSMLTDYTNYLSKYADVMKKLNSIDKSKLSAADAAYYTEVSARISKKLLEVAS